MPRKRRKKPKHVKQIHGAGRVGRPLDRKKAAWWKLRLAAAEEKKADYAKQAQEVDDYFRSVHDQLFNHEVTRNHFMDFRGAVAVSVPKSAQVRNALGPHLYIANPTRMVNPRGEDTVMLGLARVLQEYINRTPIEGKLERESRRQIDDGLLRGRGFMCTGFDSELEIVTSWAVSSRDVLIDDSAYSMADAEWIAIRRMVPLFRLRREIDGYDGNQSWRKKDLGGEYTSGSGDEENNYYDDDRKPGEKDHAPSNDMVEVWDIYSKMGCGFVGLDFPGKGKRDPGEEYDYVKLSVVKNHPVLVFEGEWETPLYLDREWPIQPLDFVETLDQLWPESVMGQVMPLQKAIDLLTSLSLISARNRGRTILFGDKSEEKRVQELVKGGDPCVYVGFEPDQKRTPMSQRFGAIDLGHQPPEIAQERNFLAAEFERTTGLTAVVTGSADEGARDRSATASRLRSQATNMRLGDMRRRVEESDTFVARNEALMVRTFFHGPDEANEFVAPYVSTEAIGMWLISIRPPEEWVAVFGVAELPVRDRRSEEERDSGMSLDLSQLSPALSTYYTSQEEAFEGLLSALEAVEAAARRGEVEDLPWVQLSMGWDNTGGDGFSLEVLMQALGQGGDPAAVFPGGAEVRMVTVEDVWRDTAGVSAKDLCRELGYEIRTSGGPEFNKEAEVEMANTLVGQALAPALNWAQSTGDVSAYNAIMKRVDDANDVPDDKRIPPLSPPAPPPMAPPQGGM